MKSLLLILLLLLLANCTTPPDVPVCENLQQHLGTDPVTGHLLLKPSPTCMKQINESECGHCTTIMTGKETYIGEGKDHLLNGKKWSEIKAESVYVPSVESYAPISTYMINSCKQMNCNSQVDAFKIKMQTLEITKP